MNIYHITDKAFRAYGKILKGYDLEAMQERMEEMPLPEGVFYEPSEEGLERLAVAESLCRKGFGGLPVQIGYCCGHNSRLNALEYHRSSEIDIAVTDLFLLLGRQQDITEEYTYDTGKLEAFFVPAKTAVELFATTLHYAPCGVKGEGFCCVVVLPRGTNTQLEPECKKTGADEEALLMTAKNKWLLAHPDAGIEGACAGLIGENLIIE